MKKRLVSLLLALALLVLPVLPAFAEEGVSLPKSALAAAAPPNPTPPETIMQSTMSHVSERLVKVTWGEGFLGAFLRFLCTLPRPFWLSQDAESPADVSYGSVKPPEFSKSFGVPYV